MLFETWVDLGLKFLRTKCKENIPSVDINIVTSLCFCYQSLLIPSRGIHIGGEFGDAVQATLNRIFAYGYVWSIGGNIDHTSIEKFDVFFRTDLETLAAFPGSDTVFEYYVNIKDQVSYTTIKTCIVQDVNKYIAYFEEVYFINLNLNGISCNLFRI